MTVVLLGSVCGLIWIIFDSITSLLRWKRARDAGRANPFHLIPSFKYKNSNLDSTSAGILDKAVKSINFERDDSRAT